MADPDVGAERAAMIETTSALDQVLRPAFQKHGLGYALIVFSIDGPGFARFVSNVERADMMRALKEMVLRLEADDLVDDDDAPAEEKP